MVSFPSCSVGFWAFHPYMRLFSFEKHFCDIYTPFVLMVSSNVQLNLFTCLQQTTQRELWCPRISGNLESRCMLTSPDKRCLSLTTLCRRWWGSDEGTQLFACRNCPCIRPLQLNAAACKRHNLSLWRSPITSNEAMRTVTGKAISFKAAPVCVPQGAIRCSVAFQQVNRNWPYF